ncbi:tripartite tricarboxylate transporter substrate binding protein [Noviherbaspirillum malthae]|uniref:tripartite tricarboxylate transporter substrate binding protein n=1 Tax=Noviherbaspirillum malthae TaxID=1260987 RepID=UPI00188DF5C1|nr:tripartite tricarboxylate transporter substrate binding protein [Noviherbaspirillum malthae]
MKLLKKYLTTMALTLLTCAAGAATAADATFQDRPIQIVVPYAAGGTIDTIARHLQPKLQTILGRPVIVDNRPGAGTMIGASTVARAEPNGHTLFLGSNAAFTISPQLMENVTYDPLRSFAAIGTVASFPNLIIVSPKSPYKTLADVIEAARKSPGKLSYASFGPASTAQLTGEAIKVAAGVDITEIPYKSGAQCVQAVLSGEVTFGFDPSVGSLQRVKVGQVNALSTTSANRMAELPQVPSIVEAGYPDAELTAWVALFAPAATPEQTQKALSEALQSVLADPQLKSKFAGMGMELTSLDSKATMGMIRNEYVRIAKLIEKAKLKKN